MFFIRFLSVIKGIFLLARTHKTSLLNFCFCVREAQESGITLREVISERRKCICCGILEVARSVLCLLYFRKAVRTTRASLVLLIVCHTYIAVALFSVNGSGFKGLSTVRIEASTLRSPAMKLKYSHL